MNLLEYLIRTQVCGEGAEKKIRVADGTMMLTEAVGALTIPEAFEGSKGLIVWSDPDEVQAAGINTIYGGSWLESSQEQIPHNSKALLYFCNSTGPAAGFTGAQVHEDDGKIQLYQGSSTREFRPGVTYHYKVYYWDEAE